MVGVRVSPGAQRVWIAGHGISIKGRWDLGDGIALSSEIPDHPTEVIAREAQTFEDYASVIGGRGLQTFVLEVDEAEAAALAAKAWNSLWIFHLLSIAVGSPCFPLYSFCDGQDVAFTCANRDPIIRPIAAVKLVAQQELEWATVHRQSFDNLISNTSFGTAMRCYGNAHYLADLDVRLMVLWAGIEGLLSVDAELNRRIALYAALLHPGDAEEKARYYGFVKKAYGIRSKAVHGGKVEPRLLQDGYMQANDILAQLLRRCVELGRVPKPHELDDIAVQGTLRA